MKLVVVAIILSVIALAVAISQPSYNFYTSMSSGKPSFEINACHVDQFATFINLVNNGTATAHNVRVQLNFYGPAGLISSAEFLSELQSGVQNDASLDIPIGSFQMTYGGWNESSYQAGIIVECKELSKPMVFMVNP